MSRISLKTFGGIIPKVSPRNLPTTAAQTAQNAWLAETHLAPIKEPLVTSTLTDASRISLYLWRRNDSSEWLDWLEDVDVCQGPIADDSYDRIYYTDGTTLHMKLWSGGKVEVDDVSKTAPSAPTVSKSLLMRIVQGSYAGGSNWYKISAAAASDPAITYDLLNYTWNANILTLDYQLNNKPESYVAQTYGVRVTFDDDGSTPTAAVSAAADFANVFANTITNGTTCTFKVTDVQYLKIEGDPSTIYSDHTMIRVTVFVDFGQNEVQYQNYACTWIDAYGAESPPSTPTDQVMWSPNDKITLTAPSPAGASKVRIYRSATGTTESNWFFVAEVDPGATYVDVLRDADLSEVMPIIENPPSAMSGLVSMPGGYLAAFYGKDIYFSEPYLPYSWPTRYRLTVDYDVVGLAVSGNDLVILTKGTPYYASGTHPEIIRLTKIPVEQSCVSKRGIAFADRFVLYPSPDGLVSITGGDVKLVTASFYTRAQWQALTPSGMIGSVHDGRYIGFHSGGGIIFDFNDPSGTLTTTDQTATGAFCDLVNDQLYLIQINNNTEWRGGASNLTATWKSKEFQSIKTPIWNSAMVIAGSYNAVTMYLYADDVLIGTYSVTSDKAFRLAKATRYERWSIVLETTDPIYEVILASSMTSLRSGTPEDPKK